MALPIAMKAVLLSAALFTSFVRADEPTAASGVVGWFGPEFGVLQKVYDDCQNKNDFTGCLKGKALVALTKAASQVCKFDDAMVSVICYYNVRPIAAVPQDSISIVDGVYLERQNDTTAIEATPSLTSARALSDLTGVDRQLMQKLDYFLRSHVVKMDMSEGREKDKKGR